MLIKHKQNDALKRKEINTFDCWHCHKFVVLNKRIQFSNAMPAADKLLSSLFRSSRKVPAAIKRTSDNLTSRAGSSDSPLKQFVSAIDSAKEAVAASSSPSAAANSTINSSANPSKPTSSLAQDPADDDPFYELGPKPDPAPDPSSGICCFVASFRAFKHCS